MRSIRVRLALIFSAITLGAIAGVYVYVAPQLESSLRDQKLEELTRDAGLYSRDLIRAIGTNVDEGTVNRAVRQAADRSGSRVTLFGVSRGTQGLQTYPISDSTAQTRLEDVSFAVATDAARTGRTQRGTEPTTEGRIGEAARPLFFNGRVARVVVFSAPLGDVQRNVELIRRQIAVAGAIMLLIASIAGYLVAQALSRRIKRLETAADKVAAGDFSQRIPIDGDDELADLASAFNEMQGQLAQLDSARKRFIATASHELRTPIFSLGGFVELLQDEDIDEETRAHFLEQISQQLARLRRLTAELLDLSRLEAGSLELRTEPTDVGDLAREVTREFTPALARHDSHLELRLTRDPIRATCDRERVAQIMRILIDNALAHTPPGTDIFVSATRENGGVRLAVRDHGLGIHRTVLPRIFEPFFTSDDAQGSGLGLAIARELAERMNGHLDVESVPGRTTFTLELPS
ncbi:MAG: HAMP domain-containing histidine kinase [Actinomycetota bacterium]|nr:HAMP domain-containing histidine kinase [Actinomycetota bacterium]